MSSFKEELRRSLSTAIAVNLIWVIVLISTIFLGTKDPSSSYQRGRADQAREDREAFFKCHKEIVVRLKGEKL